MSRFNVLLFQIASFILASVVLVACGSNIPSPVATDAPSDTSADAPDEDTQDVDAPDSETESEVSIDFTAFPLWTGITGDEPDGQGSDYWDQIVAEYEEMHPNVTVNVEMADWGTYKEVLTTRLAANNPPDMTYMCDQDTYIFRDQLVDMTPYIDEAYKADITDDTWGLYTHDGEIHGLPAMVQWNALLVNADLFEERGVPIPEGPERAWTWDEYMDAVQQLTFDRDGDGQTDVYGTAVAAINWDMEWNNLHYMFNREARFMDESLLNFELNSEQGVEALEWLVSLQDEYEVIPPGAAGLSLDDVYQMLFRGQVAMFHGAPWVISWMESAVASGELEEPVDLVIVQYPHFPDETMVTDLASCGFSVFDRADEPQRTEEAVAFAQFLANSENLRDWKAGGYFPARLSSMEGLYDENANLQTLLLMAPYGRLLWSRNVDMWSYADQMNAIIPAVFNHELTPEEALNKFVEEAQPIFDEGLSE